MLGEPAENSQPRISPQGDRVVFSRPDPQTGNRDVWYIDIGRGTTSRLTNHVANDWHAVWSPDGRQLVFGSDSRRWDPRSCPTSRLQWIRAATSHRIFLSKLSRVRVVKRHDLAFPASFRMTGRRMAAGSFTKERENLFVGPAAAAREPFRFLTTATTLETFPRFSPDGKWIAYISNESGRAEVYVARSPETLQSLPETPGFEQWR